MTCTCPTCGSPHDTWNGVARHMMAIEDEQHPEIRTVNEAIEHMVAIGHIGAGEPTAPELEDDDVQEPVDDEPEAAAATDGGNPALHGPEGKDPPSSSDETLELPCGHEEVSLAELEEEQPETVGCDECGKAWTVSDV